jgi:hypothetical protein
MVNGVKSRYFGCYWQSMFLSAIVYPENVDPVRDKETIRHYKNYYSSFKYILPCKFCREFIQDTLEKKYPLDFSGKINLMHSLYIWKDAVNNKLISQGCTRTKKSPPFDKILKKFEKLHARCNPKIGKCV